MIDPALRRRLLALARRDAETRARLAADGSLFDFYHPEMQSVHEANAAALGEMIDRSGWPTEAAAGADGSEAAWLVAQHAIGLPDFQRRCLARLERAAASGEVPPWQPAYLADRIRTLEGRAQLYGTQFDWDDEGKMRPLPIEDPAEVDARRAAVGLEPMAEATARMRRGSSREAQPADPGKRRREMEEWARKVGWR